MKKKFLKSLKNIFNFMLLFLKINLKKFQKLKKIFLKKFEKYVVSYVIAGSLVRGDVTKESDVDVFIVINDTDVKRMPRLELKERLRSIIFQYISEATALAGLKKNFLNVQPYLLTEFWESVKDANPVMFTCIRDGVPLYDRGTFMPWKALLKMGKLKPSPEAIDMFMSMGDKTVKRAKKALLEIVVHDIYWSIIKAKAEFKKGKSNAHKVDNARKNATLLINDLIEYSQRCDLVSLEKGRMIIKYKEKDKDAIAELLSCDSKSFLFRGNSVVKLTDKISPSNMEEVSESVNKQKEKKNVEISTKIFELLRKELGDFEIIL